MGNEQQPDLEQQLAEACTAAIEMLRAAEVPAEGLAEFVPERRGFLRRRAAMMRPIGEVWRLGPLLLSPAGDLYAAGRATRAAERGRPGYQSVSREERREIAAAALRGGYPEGAPVNYDAEALPRTCEALRALGPDSPLGIADGALRVRWSRGAPLSDAPTLRAFLTDRASLLADPPSGAG